MLFPYAENENDETENTLAFFVFPSNTRSRTNSIVDLNNDPICGWYRPLTGGLNRFGFFPSVCCCFLRSFRSRTLSRSDNFPLLLKRVIKRHLPFLNAPIKVKSDTGPPANWKLFFKKIKGHARHAHSPLQFVGSDQISKSVLAS